MSDTYWIVGHVPGTNHIRYGTKNGVQISRPDGRLIDKPDGWKQHRSKKGDDVDVRYMNFQVFSGIARTNGEQPRRPVWRRAGKRVEGGMT